MWFKKSFIPLSAAVILTALSSENYLASSIFFILSWNERMKENDEDNRIIIRRIQDEWEERRILDEWAERKNTKEEDQD